jgi:hypothetical protein
MAPTLFKSAQVPEPWAGLLLVVVGCGGRGPLGLPLTTGHHMAAPLRAFLCVAQCICAGGGVSVRFGERRHAKAWQSRTDAGGLRPVMLSLFPCLTTPVAFAMA